MNDGRSVSINWTLACVTEVEVERYDLTRTRDDGPPVTIEFPSQEKDVGIVFRVGRKTFRRGGTYNVTVVRHVDQYKASKMITIAMGAFFFFFV